MRILDRLRSLFRRVDQKRAPRERFVLQKEWQVLRPLIQAQPNKVRIYFCLLFLLGFIYLTPIALT